LDTDPIAKKTPTNQINEMHPMPNKQKIAEKLLSAAQITINGPNPWDITVNDDRLYGRVFHEKNLGLGEGYAEFFILSPAANRALKYRPGSHQMNMGLIHREAIP